MECLEDRTCKDSLKDLPLNLGIVAARAIILTGAGITEMAKNIVSGYEMIRSYLLGHDDYLDKLD